MRGQGSFEILVVLALVSGCSPDEPDFATAIPEPPAPPPATEPPEDLRGRPGPSQAVINVAREGQAELNQARRGTPFDAARQAPLRLVFECADGVAFAARTVSNGLVLYPPGYPPNSSLKLSQVPSESGVRYQAGDIEFRSDGDRATLEMGRERYADCTANPAAAVWRDPLTLNSEPLGQRRREVEQHR